MIVSLPTPDGTADDDQQRPRRTEQAFGRVTRASPVVPRPHVSAARSPSSTDSSSGGSGASTRISLADDGDDELQPPGVEEQALESVGPAPRGPRPVDRVARHRVAEGGEVDADLVGAARDQVELEERPAREPLADPVAGRRRPAVRRPRPSAVRSLRVAPDGRLDPADRRGDAALHQRQVGLADAARLELGHQRRLGGVVAGDDQQARGVAVEAVDDARPRDARDAAVVVAARQQGVDERAPPVPGRRVDDQAGRLVDDQQVVVLVDDLDLDRRVRLEVVRDLGRRDLERHRARRDTSELARSRRPCRRRAGPR